MKSGNAMMKTNLFQLHNIKFTIITAYINHTGSPCKASLRGHGIFKIKFHVHQS